MNEGANTVLLERLPSWMWDVPYDGLAVPGTVVDIRNGANCQSFAYAVLESFGVRVPVLRSSELWDSPLGTVEQAPWPLDLALFNLTSLSWGAHVAVCVDQSRFLHLCREVGRPVVWTKEQFTARPNYRVALGFKRFRHGTVG